jgi:hypothetical protein
MDNEFAADAVPVDGYERGHVADAILSDQSRPAAAVTGLMGDLIGHHKN